jgi:hypothetical protein
MPTTSFVVPRPAADEFSPHFAGYIQQVPANADPIQQLSDQVTAVPALLATVGEARGTYRYAPEKWSIKEIVGHLSDSERIFGYRLLRIARADETPLPGFDENAYVPPARFDERSLADLVAEWVEVRHATLALARGLPVEAWARRGVSNGKPVSARALLYITGGHVEHHLRVLRERYGVGRPA